MAKNLTTSRLDRQNILNNELAVDEIQNQINIQGLLFHDDVYFTKTMVSSYFDVELRTIERYVSENQQEFLKNGYEILRGARLKEFLTDFQRVDVPDINVGNISNRVPQLALFNFRAFLNMAMLLVESENARVLRQIILDVVIDFINQRTGGSTKYVNQRDKDFLGAFLQEENYRREFTDALRDCVKMGNGKYALYTNKIYQSIFREKAREYREILKLQSKDNLRETMYAEILTLIASYECGLASNIQEEFQKLGRKLNNWELDNLFKEFENLSHWKPLIISARTKMASRDMALRDAFHYQLREFIKPLEPREYQRFLGDEGKELEKLMQENADVLRRLKDRR